MRTELCDRFGIEYPIFVFTPSEKVAAAVSKAGGLGVLGLREVQRGRRSRDRAELDGREHRRQAVRRRYRDARKGAHRGQRDRHRQADPTEPPRFRRENACRSWGSTATRRRRALRGRARLAAFGGAVARRGGAQTSDQADRQRTGFPAEGCDRPGPRGRCPGCRAGGQRQARTAPRRERRRHRRRTGARGRWPHRRDRIDGAVAGNR